LPAKTDPKAGRPKRHGEAHDVFLYEWEGLRAFLDVARNRSFSEAAERLRIQHSTLSRRIKALEEAIGRPLLKRSPRGIELTADGTELLNVLERFDEDLSAVGRWIARGVRGIERPISVNIACTEGLAAYWLTPFLPALRKRNMLACYNIYTALSVQADKDRAFHASVQMSQPENAETSEQIGSIHFTAMASQSYVEEMGRYRAGDPPGQHRWIEYAPFRVMSGSFEAWFRRKKVEIAPFTVTNSLVTTVNSVRESAGIGLLPTYMAITMPDLVPLDAGLRLKFPIWLHIDPASLDTPELSAALGLIRAAIDPAIMPWFRDRAEPSPDYEDWRRIRNVAIGRLA
jgi:DNA-binding transcriptional LysR family regulator